MQVYKKAESYTLTILYVPSATLANWPVVNSYNYRKWGAYAASA